MSEGTGKKLKADKLVGYL